MAAVELIPPEGEREWVLDALRELVRTCGHEHLVGTPVVLPSERCFPDRWSPDARGVRRLALRILRYAGLSELDVEVALFDDDRDDHPRLGPGAVHRQDHEGAAAWFAGIVDGTCCFGAATSLLDDPGGVTAALAHESAHAFRHARGLEVEERDLEECLTDLTTIYLGMGILTANASLRHRSWGIGSEGNSLGGHAWSTQHLGYLSPQAMCFALAVFERVRERGTGERRAIVGALETNQAGFFKAARRWLEREFPGGAALRERLGVPEPAGWPKPVALEELLAAPLDEREADEGDDDVDTDPAMLVASPQRGWNMEGEAWRVPYAAAPGFGGVSLLVTVPVALTLFAMDQLWLGIAAIVGGGLATRLFSRRAFRYECSTCNGLVRREDERCALCGGKLVGTLAKAEDRLELPEP